jgi:predicted ATPase with chaperone activity
LVVAAAGGHPILITARFRSGAALVASAVHALLPELPP